MNFFLMPRMHFCNVIRANDESVAMPTLVRELPRYSPVSSVNIPDPLVETGEGARSASTSVGGSVARGRNLAGVCGEPSFRLLTGGVVTMVLKYLAKQGHLSVTANDLTTLMQIPGEVAENSQTVPVIVALVQTLAGTLSLRTAFVRWAKRENKVVNLPPRNVPYVGPVLRPWEVPRLWPFGLWSLAAQVTSRFLGQSQPPVEGVFLGGLGDLFRQTENEPWVLEVMVAALFVIKDATWFWGTLLAYNEP